MIYKLDRRTKYKAQLSRSERNSIGEEGAYAYTATIEALKNAKIDQEFLDANDVGILYGNDSTAKSVVESVDKIREKKDTTLVGSGAIFKDRKSTRLNSSHVRISY